MLIAEPLQKAIDELGKLPTIGRKTAQRLALHILKQDRETTENLVNSLMDLKDKLKFCSVCFNISAEDVCGICKSGKRDKTSVCVVEEPSDVIAIEKSNEYNGLYHVLGGVLSPLTGKGVEDLKIKELIARIESGGFTEVIFALNPDTEGETTTLYLAKMLKPFGVKLSRIARGLPMGGDLEFADKATIGRAVAGRSGV